MHMKDADREKKVSVGSDAYKKQIQMAIRRQISTFSILGLPLFNAPSGNIRGWSSPHQGRREIERRRKRISTGKFTEHDGLVRVDSRPRE